MIKLEDYRIIDFPKLSQGDLLFMDHLEFNDQGITKVSYKDLQNARMDLGKLLSKKDTKERFNQKDTLVDAQSYNNFLESNVNKQFKLKSPEWLFSKDRSLKYLILNKHTKAALKKQLLPLKNSINGSYFQNSKKDVNRLEEPHRQGLSFDEFVNDCCILINIVSGEMFKKLFVVSEHSNLIDILNCKAQYNLIFEFYSSAIKRASEKSAYSRKSSKRLSTKSTKILMGAFYKRLSESTPLKEEYLNLLKLKERHGFHLKLSDRGVKIEMRMRNEEGMAIINFLEQHFRQTLGTAYHYDNSFKKHMPTDDQGMFENQVFTENAQSRFLSEWIPKILSFANKAYGISHNHKKQLSVEQARIIWAIMQLLNLTPKKTKEFKGKTETKWINGFLSKRLDFPTPKNFRSEHKIQVKAKKKSKQFDKKPQLQDRLQAY